MITELLTIPADHFVYTNVQAIIWAGSGLKSPSNIELNTGNILADIYKLQSIDKCLIVDFKGVIQQVDHSLKPFFIAMATIDREVILLNHSDIEDQIHTYIRHYLLNRRSISDYSSDIKHIKAKGTDVSRKVRIEDINERITTLMDSYITGVVSNCFQLFEGPPRPLKSTPLLATGIYNAMLIVSDPKKFLWTCIMIASKVLSIKDILNEPLKILSVSLGASTIALTVGLLTELKVDLIDQIGPETKIFDRDELDNIHYDQSPYNYIYVGDFTIGGTEIKIAKAYADAYFCSLEHAVVIGSLFDKELYKEAFELYYLVKLDQVNENAKYGLPTNSLI